jgi:protein TonB
MTALARTRPIVLESSAFGRQRDDRVPLIFAAAGAAVLHFLAILIPLPDKPLSPIPQRAVVAPESIRTNLSPPPELRNPQEIPPKQPDPEPPRIAVPLPDPPAQMSRIETEPVVIQEYGVDELELELPIGEIVRPEPDPDYFEPGETGLVLPVGVYRPQPEFPEPARKIRLDGRVILRAVVDSGGNVGDIEILFVTEPDLGYSAAAIEAVGQWRYQPGELRGRAVPVRMTVVVDFNLY